MFRAIFLFFGYLSITLILVACGGGSGGDNSGNPDPTPQASIDGSNEQQLATAATSGVVQLYQDRIAVAQTIDAMSSNLTCSSGSYENNYDANKGSGYIRYQHCDITASSLYEFDGWVYINMTRSGDIATTEFSASYFYFDTSRNDLDITCETVISTDTTSCIYASESAGNDDRIYQLSDGLNEDGSSLLYKLLSGKVVDTDHGYITFSTNSSSQVAFLSCDDQMPLSGEIQFTDGDGKAVSVTYDSCTGYTVSYSGGSNSYNW